MIDISRTPQKGRLTPRLRTIDLEAMLCTCIRDVLCSNIGRTPTSLTDFSLFSSVPLKASLNDLPGEGGILQSDIGVLFTQFLQDFNLVLGYAGYVEHCLMYCSIGKNL